MSARPRPLDRTDRLVAAIIFALSLVALVAGGRTQGNVRDEGYYFDAAELYWSWYGDLLENAAHGKLGQSFTERALTRGFGYNHEHAALMKSLFGLSWRVLHRCHCPEQRGLHPLNYPHRHRTLGLLDEEAAMRLPTMILVALMVMVVYLFGAAAWSRAAGLVAAGLTLFAPRLFFDSQLATFDAPVAATWVLVVYAYWRALDERAWGWRAGVLMGLALAAKLNGFFLPAVLVPHYAWVWWQRRQRPPLRPFVYMATLGLLVYFLSWPWLWFDTVRHFRDYVAFHVHHVYYNMEYFHTNYNKPPFPLSFPYVMEALTLPTTTLFLSLGGAVALLLEWLRMRRVVVADVNSRGTGLLVGLNAVFPMAVITLTHAPIFGATKHFHASIPFLALLAGYAVHRLVRALPPAPWLAPALCVLMVAPAAAETWRSHPYGLTHYSMLAGGPPGGADLGLNRQFWGYATRGVLPWINAHAAPNAPVYWHDTNQAQLNMDVRTGLLRRDLRDSGMEEPGVQRSDIALVIHEKHFRKYEYWIWDFYGTTRPAVVLDDEGVPIVTVYQRPPHH